MRDNTRPLISWGRHLAAMTMVLAAGLALPSCAKKDAKTDDKTVPTPTKEIVASGPLEKLTAPAGVIAFGGAESPEALVKALAAMMGPAGSMVNPTTAANGIEQSFKLQTGAIDFAKPMRFLVIDPKAHKEGLLVAVTAKGGRAEFEKALPATKKKDDEGNAFSYTTHKTTYVNFVDDYALLTGDKELFAKNREFIKQLLGAKVGGQMSLVVSMKNVTELYSKEMDAIAEQAAHLPQQPGMSTNPEQLAELMKGMMAFARDVDSLTVSATTPEGGVVLTLDGRPKAGTALAKSTASLSAGKLSLMSKLPKDAAFAAVISMDTEHVSPLMQSLMQWSMKSTFAAGGEKLSAVTETFMKACTGEFAYAGYRQPGSENLTMVSLSGVRDAAAVKKGWDEIHAVYKDPKVAEGMKKMGMEVEVKPDAYKIGNVSVTVQETKFDPKTGGAQAAKMAAMLGPMMTSHYAVTDDVAIVAMGKDAKSAMEAWLSGKVEGGLDQSKAIAKAKAHAADNAFVLAWGSVGGVMSLLPLPAKPQIATNGDSGLSLSLGQKDGAMRLVIDVPADQIQEIFALGSQLKGMH